MRACVGRMLARAPRWQVTSRDRSPQNTRASHRLLPQNSEVHWDVDVATLVALGRFPIAVAGARATTTNAPCFARWPRLTSRSSRTEARSACPAASAVACCSQECSQASRNGCSQMNRSRASIPLISSMCSISCARSQPQGAGVIVVLHDLGHAARVADDVVLLREGRVVGKGLRDDVVGAHRAARNVRYRRAHRPCSGRRSLCCPSAPEPLMRLDRRDAAAAILMIEAAIGYPQLRCIASCVIRSYGWEASSRRSKHAGTSAARDGAGLRAVRC